MKLSLCDLAGAGTLSVIWNGKDPVHRRELVGDALDRRAVGADWPLNGLTMIGLTRLDDLQSCVESVVRDGVEGDLIEAGTWRGGATILMRATLDSIGADDRTVWLADSFQGFPDPEGEGTSADRKLHPLSGIDFLAARLDDVRAHFARFDLAQGVEFVPGFFEDTLPGLGDRRWSVVRLDGDTYDATRLALESLYPGLAAGGYLIVDDYGFIEACRRAVDDFRRDHGIVEAIEEVDWNGARWRKESDPTAASDGARPGDSDVRDGAAPAARGPAARIPTWREVELERERDGIQERLRAAEAEVERLRGSPVAGPADWVRRKVAGRG
ncbi:MAG: TylF/MycF/NovP-related O-methyltransferase [Gaiellaceae bacterium]